MRTILNKAKGRHTAPRQAILRAVKFTAAPLTAAQIQRLTRGLGPATVYRNLRHLSATGEIAAIDGPPGVTQYIGHAWHQATFSCQRCGTVQTQQTKLRPAYLPRRMFGSQTLFTSQLIAQGLCAACVRKTRP